MINTSSFILYWFMSVHSSTQSQQKHSNKFSSLVVLWAVGLVVFFLSSFLVITFHVSTDKEISMPLVVGNFYLDKHKVLSDLGIKVNLEYTYSSNIPDGYILFQNIEPASLVKLGSRVTLLVNRSKPFVNVPNLVGKNIDLLADLLNNIYVENRKYSLKKGSITYIEDDAPEGQILAHYPIAKTLLPPNSLVSLLVSKGKKKKIKLIQSSQLININIELIKSLAFHYKIPLRVSIKRVLSEELAYKVRKANWISYYKTSKILEVTFGDFLDTHFLPNAIYHPTNISSEKIDLPNGIYTVLVSSCQLVYDQERVKTFEKKVINEIFYIDLIENTHIPVIQRYKTHLEFWKGIRNFTKEMDVFEEADKIIFVDDIVL